MRNAMAFMALALLLASCTAPFTPAPAPTVTPAPPTETAIIPTASTTSTPVPPPTLAPSATALSTPYLIPTFFFALPTQTPTPASELDCRLLSQSVPNGTTFHPSERFSVGWNLMNTGSTTWYPGSVQFVFYGGSKLQLTSLLQIPTSVSPGQTVSLNVDMRAPKGSTTYTTLWSLQRGSTYFCRVKVSILVQ